MYHANEQPGSMKHIISTGQDDHEPVMPPWTLHCATGTGVGQGEKAYMSFCRLRGELLLRPCSADGLTGE